MDTGRKSFSPNSSDADLSGNELRARRGRNTTPNTSYSSSVLVTPHSSNRKRSESRSSKGDTTPQSIQCGEERSASLESSPEHSPPLDRQMDKTKMKRRKVHTYFVIEEPSHTLKNQMPFFHHRFLDGLSLLSTPLCILLSGFIFLIILWLFYYPWTVDDVRCRTSSRSLVDQLSKQFPNQPKRLWAQLRVALELKCSQEEHVADMERTPVVILLVQHKSQADMNHSNALFDSFVSCLGRMIAKLVPSRTQDSESCLTVAPPIDRHGLIHDYVISRKAEELKWEIDSNLSSSYNSGIRCFHFGAIDLLPADTVVLFHGVADSQNSLYKEATLLFSLAHAFEPDDIEFSKEDTISASYHRALEHRVQRYLRSIWEQHLGNDEVNALLSRLTPNIGVFYTNPTDLQPTPVC